MALAAPDYAGASLAPLPPASEVAPGTMVLSLSGTDRSSLRRGVAAWAAGAVALGFVAGYFVGKARAGR